MNFTCYNATERAIAVKWIEPEEKNGIILGYKLTWVPKDSNGTLEFVARSISGNIINLCKFLFFNFLSGFSFSFNL